MSAWRRRSHELAALGFIIPRTPATLLPNPPPACSHWYIPDCPQAVQVHIQKTFLLWPAICIMLADGKLVTRNSILLRPTWNRLHNARDPSSEHQQQHAAPPTAAPYLSSMGTCLSAGLRRAASRVCTPGNSNQVACMFAPVGPVNPPCVLACHFFRPGTCRLIRGRLLEGQIRLKLSFALRLYASPYSLTFRIHSRRPLGVSIW